MKPFSTIIARSITAAALLCPASLLAQDFMGLRLGMSPKEAFEVTGRKTESAAYHAATGKKIVSDTITVGDCEAYFRRSIAFDSLQQLSVVGLTHRGSPESIEAVKSCAMSWLDGKYGKPEIDSVTNDTVLTYIWTGANAVITMDSKPYNERHSFVLIYFYRRDLAARKEDQSSQ